MPTAPVRFRQAPLEPTTDAAGKVDGSPAADDWKVNKKKRKN